MNSLDKQYTTLLQDILDNGVKKQDRTGTGTLSVFGRQIRHKMLDGFPLLTTKKMPFRVIATELMWFLRGDTNIKYLVDNNCHIWDGDAYKNYLKNWEPDNTLEELDDPYALIRGTNLVDERPLPKDMFIHCIKTDDEFAKRWGELGPIYGKQWRQWGGLQDLTNDDKPIYLDQIANLINDLKTNPDSRRLMVNAWNVGELDSMVLPPCHFSFQCYSHENNGKRYLSLAWNQRSCDVGLGIPFNIASYGLLLEIIAKEVNMIPYELIGNLGDCHIYNNHIEIIKEQLNREPYLLPKLIIDQFDETNHYIGDMDDISEYNIKQFKLENYQSHPPIKLPLSN
jgi:thymidylate synthase